MKLIHKGRAPRELVEHAAQPLGADYGNSPKQAIRRALVVEQGYLCAYCLSRVWPTEESMKIDHLAPQRPREGAAAGGKQAALRYRNLLGVCRGREGRPYDEQHCDTHKKNAALSLDPTDHGSGWERSIYYEAGATPTHEPTYQVHSRNTEHEADLDEKLNLNVASLALARWAAVREVVDDISRKHPGPWTKAMLERVIKRYEDRDGQGHHAPFCEAILFYLRKRHARCPR